LILPAKLEKIGEIDAPVATGQRPPALTLGRERSVTRRIALTHGAHAVVDDEDFERLNAHKWHLKGSYAARAIYLGRRAGKEIKRYELMHRAVADAPAGTQVDHIDGDVLNNTRANLRITDATGNRRNSRKIASIRGRPCSSTFKGVHWHKGAWMAQIRVRGRRIYLGRYATERDAALAYDSAAREHFGEFAWLNFPEEVA
jgi:hypothetical protein